MIIKDTSTGLYCIAYNAQLDMCLWGNEHNAIVFENAEAVIADMNNQDAQQDRFIGQNPRPR